MFSLKNKIVLIGGAGVAVIAFLTRPSRKNFVEHIQKEMKKEGFLGKIGSVLVPFVFHEENTNFHDCLLFSLVNFDNNSGKSYVYIGFFGRWIRIQ